MISKFSLREEIVNIGNVKYETEKYIHSEIDRLLHGDTRRG